MTPTERRDALIQALMSEPFVYVEGEGTYMDPMEAGEAADALIPRVEEWLAEAWQEGAVFMTGAEPQPSGSIVNPYRRSTP